MYVARSSRTVAGLCTARCAQAHTASGFLPAAVCLDDVETVQTGQHTAVFARFQKEATAATLEKAATEVRAASSGALPTTQGWLHKKGGAFGGRRNWGKRWFKLTAEGLSYYKSPTDDKKRGAVELDGASVRAEPHAKYSNYFVLSYDDDRPDRAFYCDTDAERVQWLSSLTAHINAMSGKRAAAATPTGGGGATAGSANPMFQRPRSATLSALRVGGDRGTSELSFSLVLSGGRGSLDLVCGSEADYELWFPALQAIVAYHKADISSSIDVYRDALKADPTDSFAHVSLGQALERQGKLDEAASEYQSALEIDGGQRWAMTCYARVLGKQDKLDEAAAQYAAALALLRDPETLNAAALVHERRGALDDAVVLFEEALAVDSAFKEAHFNLAGALEQLDRREDAMAHYKAALAVDPRFKWAHASLGTSLEKAGKLEEAIEAYRAAVEIDGTFVPGLTSLATALEKQNRFAEALIHLQAAVRADPSVHDSHVLLALAYERDGSLAAARTALRDAIALDGTNPLTRVHLGRLLERAIGRDASPSELSAERAEAIAAGVSRAQLDASAAATAAAAARSAADEAATEAAALAAAEEQYRAALAASPKSKEALNALGMLLLRQGKPEEAREQLQACLRAAPLWRVAKRNLDAVRRALGEVVDTEGGDDVGGGSTSGGGITSPKSAAAAEMDPETALRASLANLSSESRQDEFFKAMKERQRAEAEAKKAREAAVTATMDEEELARHEAEQAAKAKHERRKSKMLTGQLGAYGTSTAKAGGVGRGRGMTRGKKRRATMAAAGGRGRTLISLAGSAIAE